jgi:putative (di)nucleoside polyphosphate hydrolase
MTTHLPVSGMKYQPNVAGILRRPDGMIFVGERLNIANAWQFPQGGVDEGESHEDAVRRELWEEIGVLPDDYRIVQKRGPYFYLFPPGITKKGQNGKEQYYFLCDYQGPDSRFNVAQEHPEFRAWKWIEPSEFQLSWLPEMKHDVYRQVFLDFFNRSL